MALLTCGRCRKVYSDKAYPACPECGGNPESTPMRSDYVAPAGRAPGEPPPPGIRIPRTFIVIVIAALGYAGWQSFKPAGGSAPSGSAAPAAGRPRARPAASAPWADRVAEAIREMTSGQGGKDVAEGAARAAHTGITQAFMSGVEMVKQGKEVYANLTIMCATEAGTASQMTVTWTVSQARGHGRAWITADSSPEPVSQAGVRALNEYFRDVVFPGLFMRFSGDIGFFGVGPR